jgi:hypothetical protein
MADAMRYKKVSKVCGLGGWSHVPVKREVPLLKMGKHPLNSGRECLRFQVRQENTIEEFVRNTRLEPEKAWFCMERRTRERAQESAKRDFIGIERLRNAGGREVLQDVGHRWVGLSLLHVQIMIKLFAHQSKSMYSASVRSFHALTVI